MTTALLLINSGMAPMKKYFTGQETPPRTSVSPPARSASAPRDIERVGKTARHGTFFEMLGNFSFGDYFKQEAIAWAWEFLTEVLEIPADRLYVSIYEDDDEAYEIWTQGESASRRTTSSAWARRTTSGSTAPAPAAPARRSTLTAARSTAAASPDCARRLRLRPLHGDLEHRIYPV